MNAPPIKTSLTECKGGWDQVSPTLNLHPGALRDCLNYEAAVSDGYSRIGGYERFDGRTKPSDAAYVLVQVASYTNTPTTAQILTGGTSAATGVIAYVASTYMVLTKTTGTFVDGEAVAVGATPIGTTVAFSETVTAQQTAQYTNYAADIYRTDILAVPGSGPVRGVVTYNDITYAFRNNAGATALDMYKSTTSGWAQVAFEYEVSFSNANTSVADGDTLTHTATGFTATIRRVLVETGTLVSGTNTGRLVISVQTGTMTPAGAASSTGGGALTLTTVPSAITMAVGGRFEFDIANFFGQASGLRLYGCDGVNRQFEFDGTYFVPISTGLSAALDKPKYIKEFKGHLLCQIGSSNLNSGINTPYNWTTTAGGLEKALGDTLTGYCEQPGSTGSGAITILGQNNIYMLYGTSAADWNYVTAAEGTGSLDYAGQIMSDTYFFNSNGVGSLRATQNYGNFSAATLTDNIRTFIKSKRGMTVVSALSRERSQYRVFFSDGYALYCTIANGKFKGAMLVKFPKAAYCTSSRRLANGEEILLFGSASDGYVYQIDKGTSFDGDAIDATGKFNWNHAGSPRVLKTWRNASIEMQGDAYAAIAFLTSLAYDSDEVMQPESSDHTMNFASGVLWDDASVLWDAAFFWDTVSLSPTEINLEGTAENIEVTISSGTDYIAPYTINSIILHYTPRRIVTRGSI